MRNHTAMTVAQALITHVLSRFGMPMQILTNQGSEFEGELFQELCKWFDIEKLRTTPYKASTNGMVERYHRTLNSILVKIVWDDPRDWCEKVPIAAAAYRTSVHEATGFTPNKLMLGREVFSPMDVVLGMPPDEHSNYESRNDFVASRQRMMRDVYSTVRKHLQKAVTRHKKYYDIRVRERHFTVGDWVWYYYPRRYPRKSPKWQCNYVGPFLIVRVLPPNDAVIEKSNRMRPLVVHIDKLKRYYGDPPPSWLQTQVAQVNGGESMVDVMPSVPVQDTVTVGRCGTRGLGSVVPDSTGTSRRQHG